MNRQEFEQRLKAYKNQRVDMKYLDNVAEYILNGIKGSNVSRREAKDRAEHAYTFLGLAPDQNTIVAELMFNKTLERMPGLIKETIGEGVRIPLHRAN